MTQDEDETAVGSQEAFGGHTSKLVTAEGLAAALDVTRGYVYDHADELGAIRLGSGPKARLRFDVDQVLEGLTERSPSERSQPPASPVVAGRKPPATTRTSGSDLKLLPVRAREAA